MLDSGGMRRVWVSGRENFLKRMLLRAAGFNLGLLMRRLFGVGEPRVLQGLAAALIAGLVAILTLLQRLWVEVSSRGARVIEESGRERWCEQSPSLRALAPVAFATGS